MAKGFLALALKPTSLLEPGPSGRPPNQKTSADDGSNSSIIAPGRPAAFSLDFDLQETLDKARITAELNRLIREDHPRSLRWISDEELAQRPELVRTMAVQPPSGAGQVRIVEFDEVDLQPCGGTHVRDTTEIGKATVTKIEKKGAQNRRVRIALVG